MACAPLMSHAVSLRAPLARSRRTAATPAGRARPAARPLRSVRASASAAPQEEPAGLMAELADTSRLGQRGEWLVAAQFASLLGVVAPPPPLDSLSGALGVAAALGGVAVALAGAQGLGSSLSPFPAPMRGNALVTDGIYATVRHPMYAGLLLCSFGVSLSTASPARALFTALLAAVLGAKMDVEEAALRERHGAAFEEYAARVPRVLPAVPAVSRALAAALGGLSSWAAAAAQEVEAGADK